MVKYCIVKDCKTKSSDPNARFSKFPFFKKGLPAAVLTVRIKRWLDALGFRETFQPIGKFVCNRTFVNGTAAELVDMANVDWVPTRNLPKPAKPFEVDRSSADLKINVIERYRSGARICISQEQFESFFIRYYREVASAADTRDPSSVELPETSATSRTTTASRCQAEGFADIRDSRSVEWSETSATIRPTISNSMPSWVPARRSEDGQCHAEGFADIRDSRSVGWSETSATSRPTISNSMPSWVPARRSEDGQCHAEGFADIRDSRSVGWSETSATSRPTISNSMPSWVPARRSEDGQCHAERFADIRDSRSVELPETSATSRPTISNSMPSWVPARRSEDGQCHAEGFADIRDSRSVELPETSATSRTTNPNSMPSLVLDPRSEERESFLDKSDAGQCPAGGFADSSLVPSYQDFVSQMQSSSEETTMALHVVQRPNTDLSGTHHGAHMNSSNTNNKCENCETYKAKLETQAKQLLYYNDKLNQTVKDIEWLKTDDRCNRYTGVTSLGVLKKIYAFVKPKLFSPDCNFSKEQAFIMTMRKLRRNNPFVDLADEYEICPNTASKYFYRTVKILHDNLQYVLEAPAKEITVRHTPQNFKNYYGDRRVILVDCFEVRTETSSNAKAANAHHSSYKMSHTTKFLIAAFPDGSISFISNAFVGRCSDRFIIKESGFLNLLEPGDVVLADKGFDISDMISSKGATLNIPTFLKKKNQMNPLSIERDRQITSLRVHIERIIGTLKNKFEILQGVFEMSSLKRFENNCNGLDLIVRLCCILLSFNRSIISQ